MGDVCDMHDIDRFLRSPEGKKHLKCIKSWFVGRRIRDVTFTNETFGIMMTLEFERGEPVRVLDLSLQIEVIRDEFPEVLEREYYRDFPERR